MYGTIGRFHIKPGMEGRFRELIQGQSPGRTALSSSRVGNERGA